MSQTGSKSLFPNYARFPITLVKGEGSRVWDDRGKEYIDLAAGLAVTNLGHVPPKVKQRLMEQVDRVWHVSNLFSIPDQENLADLLTANSCADRVFFCNSGAEANEAAIKLARRYNHSVLGNNRYEIITFHQSFHGRTLATLTATGQDKVKDGFAPLPDGFVTVPYNDAEAIAAAVGDRTCAIMLELVQGEGGVNAVDPAFLREIDLLRKEHDLLFIVDEIQTGIGRTGRMFAYEHFGVEPDIITLAKGLGSGFPIGAMLAKEKLAEAFTPGTHGTTFGGNPLAVAVGLATVETMLEEKVPERTLELGHWAVEQLRAKLGGHPLVKEVRGLGLLIGIECTQAVAPMVSAAHEAGALVISAGPNVVRLVPALTISKEELQEGIDRLCAVMSEFTAAAVQ